MRIPAARYLSADWAAAEAERLWPRVWQVACTVDHVPSVGDVWEHRCGPLSVLVVRGDDGALRAFQNACRHRGNVLCDGAARGLDALRCGYHRWTWDLKGALREVPSRHAFGGLRNDDLPLLPVQVGEWAGLVFVNLDLDAEPLEAFLGPVPDDLAWAELDRYRCLYGVSVPLRCNWKTAIEGFSETYHVQGIHREMLPMCDDVNSPNALLGLHGRLLQPYGVPSPRLRGGASDDEVWRAYVEVMGMRAGRDQSRDPGPPPPVRAGESIRDAIEGEVRATAAANGVDLAHLDQAQVMDLFQYNLFPNTSLVVMADFTQVVRVRPGPTPDECVFDGFFLGRLPDGAERVGDPPPHDEATAATVDLGLVLGQDLANLPAVQRGLHQPGLTELVLGAEEVRIAHLHANLERWLEVAPG